MKKILFILTLLLIPTFVFAKENAQLDTKLNEVLGGQHKIIVKDKTLTNQLLLNMSQDEPDPESDYDGYTIFMTAYVNNLPEVKAFLEENKDDKPVIRVYCKLKNKCGIKVEYESNNIGGQDNCNPEEYYAGQDIVYPGCFYTTYDVEITNPDTMDQSIYNTIKEYYQETKIGDRHTKYFYLYDLAYINQLYYQNNGQSNFVDNPMYFEGIARSFPEINDITKGNKDLTVKYGGNDFSPGSNYTGSDVIIEHSFNYVVYYKDVAYLTTNFMFDYAPVLFVEDTTSDDKLMEAAQKRIEDYLNNSNIKVTIDDITPTFEQARLDAIYNDLNTYLEKIGSTERANANTRVYSLKIGNTTSPKNLYIFKTKKENIKALELQSIEKSTGVRFTSSSAIPIDSVFDVKDVTEQYKKLNDKLEQAYNISLFSQIANANVKSIAGGIKIYIPVSSNYVIGNKKIVYLDENGKAQETFNPTMETIAGQNYITFTTTHLSVYGVIDNDKNPNTADYLMIILGTLFVATIILVIVSHQKVRRYE